MIEHHGVPKKDRIHLYKVTIANSDVSSALFTTRLFLKTVKSMKSDGFMPLQDSIVVAYARPFTSNKPYGPLDKKWGLFNISGMQNLHDQIIEYRHKLVAHSDKKYRTVQIIPKGTAKVPVGPSNVETAIQLSTTKFTMDTFTKIEKLCLNLGGRLNQEMFRMIEKLYSNGNLPSFPFDLL